MREYLKRVLELVRPYRFRFVLGLACGFLSGMLAFTLPVSLKLAVDTVFPTEKAAGKTSGAATNLSALGAGSNTNQTSGKVAQTPSDTKQSFLPSGGLKRALDDALNWFRPSGRPSTARTLLVISLIPGAMLLRGLLGYLNIYLLSWVGIRAANDLRARLFDHLIHMPMSFFGYTTTGHLMAQMEATMQVNYTINGSF